VEQRPGQQRDEAGLGRVEVLRQPVRDRERLVHRPDPRAVCQRRALRQPVVPAVNTIRAGSFSLAPMADRSVLEGGIAAVRAVDDRAQLVDGHGGRTDGTFARRCASPITSLGR